MQGPACRAALASSEPDMEFDYNSGVWVRKASEKQAGGLYGFPTKTARLSLGACMDLRAYIGEVAFGLHTRRAAKYAKITGFLKEHGKTAKCAYSRIILDCYPDGPTIEKQAAGLTLPSAYVSAIQSGVAETRSHHGLEAMEIEEEAKEKYPWDECIKEQTKAYGAEAAPKICGKIRAESQGRKAAIPDSVESWLEWEDGTRTALDKFA